MAIRSLGPVHPRHGRTCPSAVNSRTGGAAFDFSSGPSVPRALQHPHVIVGVDGHARHLTELPAVGNLRPRRIDAKLRRRRRSERRRNRQRHLARRGPFGATSECRSEPGLADFVRPVPERRHEHASRSVLVSSTALAGECPHQESAGAPCLDRARDRRRQSRARDSCLRAASEGWRTTRRS